MYPGPRWRTAYSTDILCDRKKKKKPQQQAERITHCLISMWFTVIWITFVGFLNQGLANVPADACEHTN